MIISPKVGGLIYTQLDFTIFISIFTLLLFGLAFYKII